MSVAATEISENLGKRVRVTKTNCSQTLLEITTLCFWGTIRELDIYIYILQLINKYK